MRGIVIAGMTALLFAGGVSARAQTQDATLGARIAAIVNAPITAGTVAGTSVAVVKGGTTLVSKAYGMADLELDVPTPANASYEIGSVTKQFTAAAVLLLRDEGKLSLDDSITTYLPDYPTQGHTITLKRLLNHTSGIKGYTELDAFGDFMLLQRPREDLVKLFAAQPLDFPPGDEQIYNNSAFFLLGLVIERVSGQAYQAFVQQRLFDRVGMRDSYYCSERTIRKRHAHGYDSGPDGLQLKGYLNHLWPYAAGSLCSTTADLVAWTQALHAGRVVSAASYKEMITPGLLNDGTATRYGYGIGVADLGGRRAIAHGGGINGFLSEVQYYPAEDLIVVVLQNTAGPLNPRETAKKIVEAVLGPAPSRAVPFTGAPADYSGTYSGRGRGRPTTLTIAGSGTGVTMTRAGGAGAKAEPLEYRGGDTFASGDTLVIFERQGGAVTRLRLDTGSGHNVLVRKP